MKLCVVLNGGLQSCCSVYSPEIVHEIVENWTEGMCEVRVIDAKKEAWEPDEMASLAIDYFGEYAYPFIYIDDVLINFGHFPTRRELFAVLLQEKRKSVSKKDMIEAAKKYGFIKEVKDV